METESCEIEIQSGTAAPERHCRLLGKREVRPAHRRDGQRGWDEKLVRNTRQSTTARVSRHGYADGDIILLTQVNDRTVEATLKKGGKVTTNARRAVSADENADHRHQGHQRTGAEGE